MLTEISKSALAATELGKLIDETIIGRNAERNRKVCKRVFLDGIPYERVAEEFDLSRSQVERVIRTGFTRIKNHI